MKIIVRNSDVSVVNFRWCKVAKNTVEIHIISGTSTSVQLARGAIATIQASAKSAVLLDLQTSSELSTAGPK